MTNPVITNCDRSGVLIDGRSSQPDIITFAGAGTLLAGTILARDSVSLKLVPFVKGGSTNENGIPKTLITCAVTATGAGDETVSVLTDATVRKDKLVIDADADNSNVDAAVLDQLRAYNIIVEGVKDLSELDNQ